jgi:hypothetical protein
MMLTSNVTLRARASLVAALASLLGSLGGCIIDAKIGDDPLGGSEDTGGTDPSEGESTSTTGGPGTASVTSGAPGTASATTTSGGSPGSASVTSTTGSPGEDDGSTLDALEQCGVVVVPPEPDGPIYQEGIECEGGCQVDVESGEPTGIYELGDCVCMALGCGSVAGGTTGTSGEPPGNTESDSGEPDGCGPFPDGDVGFTCSCEMCSIDVTNVDAAWLENEADLEVICECMCGGAGCGSPV